VLSLSLEAARGQGTSFGLPQAPLLPLLDQRPHQASSCLAPAPRFSARFGVGEYLPKAEPITRVGSIGAVQHVCKLSVVVSPVTSMVLGTPVVTEGASSTRRRPLGAPGSPPSGRAASATAEGRTEAGGLFHSPRMLRVVSSARSAADHRVDIKHTRRRAGEAKSASGGPGDVRHDAHDGLADLIADRRRAQIDATTGLCESV